MRTLLALALLVAACSGPPKKPDPMNEGSEVPDNCCCKWNPIAAENGEPKWEMAIRMECSSRHGDCVDNVQCEKQPVIEEGPPAPEAPE